MKELKFYDMKLKKAFKTEKYEIKTKNGRKFATCIAPSGVKSFLIVKKDFTGK